MEKLPEDYETCGDCGFDHSYEYEAAASWHEANPCSYCIYNERDKKHEASCPIQKLITTQ